MRFIPVRAPGQRRFSTLVSWTCLAIITLAATGCASRYKITLNNGSTITTKGRPKLDPEAGAYHFKDAFGKPATIPMFRVKEIEAL